MLNVGCFLSKSGGYLRMGKTALKLGANTFQYFSRNPRGGSVRAFDPKDAHTLQSFLDAHGFASILAHTPYTLNPCAVSEETLHFARIINHPALRHLPFHLETPNDLEGYRREISLLRTLYHP